MTHATIGIHLKIIILNESSQIKKRVYEILENANESIVSCLEMWWRLEGRRKLLGGCVHYLKYDADSIHVYINQNIKLCRFVYMLLMSVN